MIPPACGAAAREDGKEDTMDFTPASDVWTLGYDELNRMCWRHNKTQERRYVPPGQPLTLPPKSLANGFRPNLADSPHAVPAATARAEAFPRIEGVDNNSVLMVTQAASIGPAPFTNGTKSNVKDSNHGLPPKRSENAPHSTPPIDASITPVASIHPEKSFLQGGVDEEQLNDDSTLGVRPASTEVATKPHPCSISRTDNAKDGSTRKGLEKKPRPSISHESNGMKDKDHAKTSRIRSGGKGEKFTPKSAWEVPEAGRGRPAYTGETTKPKPHPCSSMSRTEDANHGLTLKSLEKKSRSSISQESNSMKGKDHAKAAHIRSGGEGGFKTKSALEVPGAGEERPSSTVEYTKPHPFPSMSSTEDAKHGVTRKNLEKAPPTSKGQAKASRVRSGGEGEEFNKDAALEVPEAGNERPTSIFDATKPHPCSSMSRTENPKHRSTRQSLDIAPPTSKGQATASRIRGRGEGKQLEIDSDLEIPEAARVPTASTVEGTNDHMCSPTSWSDDGKHELSWKSVTNACQQSLPNQPHLNQLNKDGVEVSSVRMDGEGEERGIDSTVEVPEALMVRTPSTVEDTKLHPCSPMSRTVDMENELTQTSLENEPRLSVSLETENESDNKDPAEASCIGGDDEGKQVDNDSTLDIFEDTGVPVESTVEDTKPETCSPMSNTNDMENILIQTNSEIGPRPGDSLETENDSENKDPAEAACIGGDEGKQVDNDATLEIPEDTGVPPEPTVEDTKPDTCSPISKTDDMENGLIQTSSENEPRLSVSLETEDDSDNKDPAEASCIGGDNEGKQVDNDSTLEIPEDTGVPPEPTVEDTKPDTCSPTTKDIVSAMVSVDRGYEEEKVELNSAPDVPEAARLGSAPIPQCRRREKRSMACLDRVRQIKLSQVLHKVFNPCYQAKR